MDFIEKSADGRECGIGSWPTMWRFGMRCPSCANGTGGCLRWMMLRLGRQSCAPLAGTPPSTLRCHSCWVPPRRSRCRSHQLGSRSCRREQQPGASPSEPGSGGEAGNRGAQPRRRGTLCAYGGAYEEFPCGPNIGRLVCDCVIAMSGQSFWSRRRVDVVAYEIQAGSTTVGEGRST